MYAFSAVLPLPHGHGADSVQERFHIRSHGAGKRNSATITFSGAPGEDPTGDTLVHPPMSSWDLWRHNCSRMPGRASLLVPAAPAPFRFSASVNGNLELTRPQAPLEFCYCPQGPQLRVD